MHLMRKVVRKSVRKVTPRPIRQIDRAVRHPVLTTYYAVAPKPIKQAERSVYNITHPINAVENKAVNTVIGPPIRWTSPKTVRGRTQTSRAPRRAPRVTTPSPTEPTSDENIYDRFRKLADRADPATRPQLAAGMAHEDPIVRKLAVRGVARLRDPNDDPLLAAALSDSSDDVRIEAAHAAYSRTSENLRHALTTALDDPQAKVRELARQALAKLDGEAPERQHVDESPSEPAEHTAEESDPVDLQLALRVAAHHGEMSLTVRELLDIVGRKKLTQAAIEEIEDTLEDAGLRSEPKVSRVEINDDVRLIRREVIPEFALRGHVDESGPWTMPLHDLLRTFDRWMLSSHARTEIAEALEYADLTTDPPISVVDPHQDITIKRR